MQYQLLANSVVVVHALFVLFVVLGGILVLRWPWLAWLHIPAALWGAGIEFMGGICPLTPLENHWRALAGEQGYAGGFVDQYITAALYPAGLTRDAQIVLGTTVLLLNVVVYAYALYKRKPRA
jgi:hypothetical protein